MTTSSPSTASAPQLPWPADHGPRRRRRLRAALRAHALASGTGSLAANARVSTFPTPHSSTRTAADSSPPRSPGAATHLDTGVNGYESEFSHDVVGILANLFTQGYFADAHGC